MCILSEGLPVFSTSGRRLVACYVGEEIVIDVVHDFCCRDSTAV